MTLEFFFEATGEGNGESATAKTNRDIIILPISKNDSIQPYNHIRIILVQNTEGGGKIT